ncbi:MAG: hypothetical protein ACR2RV_10535 [Verrucomicrobiales bacterium]
MGLLHAVGDELVNDAELAERGPLAETGGAGASERSLAPERFRVNMNGDEVPFTPVGIGKPLTIEVQKIYRGAHGSGGFGSGKRDLLCVSATRATSSFNKAPRAINLLDENFDPAKRNHRIHASKDGTTLLYHTPSVTDPSQVITFEMTIDRFPKDGVQQLVDAIRSASQLPVFASASLFMMTGSSVIKLLGSIAERIFDGSPFFVGSHDIRFGVPPYSNNTAGQYVLVNDEDEDAFMGYQIHQNGTLVQASSGEPYEGDLPYVSITLDGAPRTDLKDFQAAEASTELLGRFYGSDTGTPSDDLLAAVKLLNDSKLRRRAEQLQGEIEALDDPEDPQTETLQQLLKATLKRITDPAFKGGL